jgi:hypothetical protein
MTASINNSPTNTNKQTAITTIVVANRAIKTSITTTNITTREDMVRRAMGQFPSKCAKWPLANG